MVLKCKTGSDGGGADALTRRSFLKTSAGLVALCVTPVALRGQTAPDTLPNVPYRIDGPAKVTGQKVFARDFRAADVWQGYDREWHALFLRATRTDAPFTGLDETWLQEVAATKVIYGDQVDSELLKPNVDLTRDILLDQPDPSVDTEKDFDRPDDYLFDLVVRRGNQPDFLGQAVALLLFDDARTFRAARTRLQFQDDKVQFYGPVGPPKPPVVFSPQTLFVRVADPIGGPDIFSFASAENTKDYLAAAPKYQKLISSFIEDTPDLIRHPIDCATQAMDPVFMEPESGLAWFQPQAQKMSLVLGTQSPDGDVKAVARMYNGPGSPGSVSEVHLQSCYPGGGFGGRDSSPFTLMIALAAAFTDGNPVRLEYDRFEQFRVGLKRHAATLKGELAVDQNMKLRALQMDIVLDGGGRQNLSPYVAQLAAICSGNCYNLPLNNLSAQANHTQDVSGGSQRGFGGPQAFFAVETALDEIARQQNWDPFAFRRANLITDGDRTVVGGPYEPGLKLRKILDMAEQHVLWQDRAQLRAQYAQRGKIYGTGMAMSLLAFGTSGDGVVAGVQLTQGGIKVLTNAVDMGNGSATTLAAVVEEELGRPAGHIDTGDYTLFGKTQLDDSWSGNWDDPKWTAKGVGSSSASLTAFFQTHVTQNAARALYLQSVLPAARDIWGLDVGQEDVRWELGHLIGPRDAEPLHIGRLHDHIVKMGLPTGALAHAYFQQQWATGTFALTPGPVTLPIDGLAFYFNGNDDPTPVWRSKIIPPPKAAQRSARSVFCPSANVIGVSVDASTGAVRVENVVTFLDPGRVYVEPLVSGQSQGGLAMAIGYTLMEDVLPGPDGPGGGRWNLNRYHVPRMEDVPLSETLAPGQRLQQLVLVQDQTAQAGKGIAESVMCCIAPAISNALADAIGHRFTSLPISAEQVLERMPA